MEENCSFSKTNYTLPGNAWGRIASSAPLDKRIIFSFWQSLTTTDILFLSDVNSRMSNISYCRGAPLKLTSEHVISKYNSVTVDISYQETKHLLKKIVCKARSRNRLRRIFPHLLIRTICNWEAAFTKAYSSWDCALYIIVPPLLKTTKQNESPNNDRQRKLLHKKKKYEVTF